MSELGFQAPKFAQFVLVQEELSSGAVATALGPTHMIVSSFRIGERFKSFVFGVASFIVRSVAVTTLGESSLTDSSSSSGSFRNKKDARVASLSGWKTTSLKSK